MGWREGIWRKKLNNLVRFRRRNPDRWPAFDAPSETERRLAHWCKNQRDSLSKERLSCAQMRSLDEIGFVWTPGGDAWDHQLALLVEFRRIFPDRWPMAREEFPPGCRLGSWCDTQRARLKQGEISIERLAKLDAIQFPWSPFDEAWPEQLSNLQRFRQQFPNAWPRSGEEFPPGTRLGVWCQAQRRSCALGKLAPERTQQLDQMGFPWSGMDEAWDRQFQKLIEFRERNPSKWPSITEESADDRRLGSWCHVQRKAKKRGLLAEKRIGLLDSIDFTWIIRKRAVGRKS